MAALVATSLGALAAGRKALNVNTLTGSDTFVYSPGTNQRMVLINNTAGALVPRLVGDAASASANAAGGPLGVSLTAGYVIASIAPAAAVTIALDEVANYLQGNCTIQTGTGLTCLLLQ